MSQKGARVFVFGFLQASVVVGVLGGATARRHYRINEAQLRVVLLLNWMCK
jgi:hypothetical protein